MAAGHQQRRSPVDSSPTTRCHASAPYPPPSARRAAPRDRTRPNRCRPMAPAAHSNGRSLPRVGRRFRQPKRPELRERESRNCLYHNNLSHHTLLRCGWSCPRVARDLVAVKGAPREFRHLHDMASSFRAQRARLPSAGRPDPRIRPRKPPPPSFRRKPESSSGQHRTPDCRLLIPRNYPAPAHNAPRCPHPPPEDPDSAPACAP